jgi:hypothetical protein
MAARKTLPSRMFEMRGFLGLESFSEPAGAPVGRFRTT